MNDKIQVIVSIECRGPAFVGKNGELCPEPGVADVLFDIVAQLRSGTKLVDLHGEELRAWTGHRVGAVLVTVVEQSAK